MDERKLRIYCFLIKMGKITINDVPIEYQAVVTENLDKFNIADLEEISKLKEDLSDISLVIDGLSLDIQSLIEYLSM